MIPAFAPGLSPLLAGGDDGVGGVVDGSIEVEDVPPGAVDVELLGRLVMG